MKKFIIHENEFLKKKTTAFYFRPYIKYDSDKKETHKPYHILKNTFCEKGKAELKSATEKVLKVLLNNLPGILNSSGFEMMTVCVVPRARVDNYYNKDQLLFRSTVQDSIKQLTGFEDGTNFICRHTDTKTTHLANFDKLDQPRRDGRAFENDGDFPRPGITEDTCEISPKVRGKNILLIDDIYTPGVNIDEDAIQSLLNNGANTVIFYAIAKAGG